MNIEQMNPLAILLSAILKRNQTIVNFYRTVWMQLEYITFIFVSTARLFLEWGRGTSLRPLHDPPAQDLDQSLRNARKDLKKNIAYWAAKTICWSCCVFLCCLNEVKAVWPILTLVSMLPASPSIRFCLNFPGRKLWKKFTKICKKLGLRLKTESSRLRCSWSEK